MAAGERLTFGLTAGDLSEEELVVLHIAGTEALSAPFLWDVEVRPASGDPIDLDALIGRPAQLALRRVDGPEAFVHGECVAARYLRLEDEVPRYRLRIGPRLLRAGQVQRSRIFQGQTVPEIVQTILDEHGVDHTASLSGSYPQREYVVQYRETDLAFVTRLLAAEGIWWRFEQAEGSHALVLCDAGAGFAVGPQLPVREGEQGHGVEHLYAVQWTREVVPNRAARRDYDFEHPGVDLTSSSGKGALEVYEYPGGHLQPGDGARQAQVRREELGLTSEVVSGQGNAIAVRPGVKLEIEQVGTVAVTGVVHRGEQQRATGQAASGTTYASAFTGIDAARPYRPPRRSHARVRGVHTGTVVGPAGEEIHVDAHGRIRVQMHWDRDGKRDARSSCWIRAAQAWAGPGMGASFVPRIGQEVVVRFLEGEGDRPLVTGAVFNGATGVPLLLPGDRTRSTVRTDSSPGGGGSNELRLEDLCGAEEVYAHAQKDANAVVEHDTAVEVKRDAALQVGQDRSRRVGQDHELAVAATDTSSVGGDQDLRVAGQRDTSVAASHAEEVGGNQTVTIGGHRHLTTAQESLDVVGAAASLEVGALYAVQVGDVCNVAVGGARTVQVGGMRIETVAEDRDERVGKNASLKVGGDSAADVNEGVGIAAGGDGRVEVGGNESWSVADVAADQAAQVKLQADRFVLVVGGKKILELTSSGVKLSGASVAVTGAIVALKGSPIGKSSGAPPSAGRAKVKELKAIGRGRGVATVVMKDQNGLAIPNLRWKAKLPDGSTRTGRTDGEGRAAIPVAKDPKNKDGKVTVTFLDVDKARAKLR